MTQKRKGKIKLKKRLLSILLTAVLLLSAVPLGLVDTAYAASGSCGDKLTWSLSDDGVLTISGTGKMADFELLDTKRWWLGTNTPWCGIRQSIERIKIDNGVTSIGIGAFFDCFNLNEMCFGENLEDIRGNAFYNCIALAKVTIPDSVTSIGDHAFCACDGLTEVTISGNVASMGQGVFASCKNLTDVVIQYGIRNIPTSTFSGCSSLTNVTIPESVTSIGDAAFGNCKSLLQLTIPCSVEDIASRVFSGCNAFLNVDSGNRHYRSVDGALYDKSQTILYYAGRILTGKYNVPAGVKIVGDFAFSGKEYLTEVIIPEDVTHIGGYAFSECSNLKNVVIPKSVTKLPHCVFYRCGQLTSVTISKSIASIGRYTFNGCTSLTDVYYDGTASDWAKVTIEEGNEPLTNATLHCAKSAPAAPVVKLGNSATSGKPVLTWNAVPGATSYKVYRATSKSGTYSLLGTVTTTSYTNTGAKEGTTYYYKVKAANGAGESAYSNVVSGKVVVTPKPAAPVVRIGNSASSGKPMLTWNAVGGATSYRIYRSTSKGSGYSLLGTVTATSYTNTGAKAGTTYYYRVKACNDAGLSPYSNVVSGKVKSVTPKPAAPVVKIGNSATSGKPMLTWNAVSGATSYKVYRATSQKGTYSLLGTVTTTSYTNTGAKAGTTYYYKVKAVNSAGESAYSNIVSGRATVTILTMGHSATSGKPQLTWKAVSGAASYKVYRATTKNGAYTVINTTKALTYTNVGAALGTTYYYKVEALNTAGKSMGFSAIVEGKVAPVLAVGYSSVSGKPQLTWKAVPGATEYQVYRSTQQNSGYAKINTTTSTSYVNTGAKAGTTYYYRIVAVKGTAVSDFSNIVSARPGK